MFTLILYAFSHHLNICSVNLYCMFSLILYVFIHHLNIFSVTCYICLVSTYLHSVNSLIYTQLIHIQSHLNFCRLTPCYLILLFIFRLMMLHAVCSYHYIWPNHTVFNILKLSLFYLILKKKYLRIKIVSALYHGCV